MKKLTILDLATILQLNESIKDDLRKNFDSWDDELKYEIQKVLWDGVHELKDRLAKLKYEQFMLEVEQGKRQLMTNMYSEAVKAAWEDLEGIAAGKNKDTELIEEIRTQLKPLVNIPNSV